MLNSVPALLKFKRRLHALFTVFRHGDPHKTEILYSENDEHAAYRASSPWHTGRWRIHLLACFHVQSAAISGRPNYHIETIASASSSSYWNTFFGYFTESRGCMSMLLRQAGGGGSESEERGRNCMEATYISTIWAQAFTSGEYDPAYIGYQSVISAGRVGRPIGLRMPPGRCLKNSLWLLVFSRGRVAVKFH